MMRQKPQKPLNSLINHEYFSSLTPEDENDLFRYPAQLPGAQCSGLNDVFS
jgi:hypothetical protein